MLELLQHLEHSHRVIDFSLLILILGAIARYSPGSACLPLRLSSLERDPSSLLEVLASTYLQQHTTGLSLQIPEVEWVCFLIPALQVSEEVRKIE